MTHIKSTTSVQIKKHNSHPIVVLGLIVWIAFALRVYGLDHHAIWGDEAFSINVAMMALGKIVAGGTDTHPPLYHVLLHLWMRLAGSSAFAARFLSLIPGMLLVPTIYAIGYRLLGRWPAILAAGLAALSAFMIYYSQETRMYAWAALFIALSVYAFVRLVDAADSRNPFIKQSGFWLPFYMIATLAAMYSHYYVFFVIAAQNLYALWRGLKHRRWLLKWIGIQGALAIAYLPWIIAQTGFLSGRANTRLDAWSLSGMQDVWVESLISFGGATTTPTQFKWLALFPVLVVVIGMIGIVRRMLHGKSGGSAFAVLYLIVPMLVAWLVGPMMPFFYERYLLVAFPAYLLLLAAGLMMLFRLHTPFSMLGAFALALALCLNLYSLNNYYHNPAYAKSGYRDLMAYVASQSQAGDAFLLLNPEQRDLYNYYGFKGIPAYWFPPSEPWESSATQEEMAKIEATHDRLWLVLFGNASDWDFGNGLQNWLNAHAFQAYHGNFVDGGLELYIIGNLEPSESAEADFAGVINLTAYGVSSNTIHPGDTLQVALSWETAQTMDKDYTIFTHLVDDQQKLWGQMDSPPAGGTRPTSTWTLGEAFVDRLAFQVDPSAPPGTYWLEVGWYDLTTLTRLPVLDAQGERIGDKMLLVQINIE